MLQRSKWLLAAMMTMLLLAPRFALADRLSKDDKETIKSMMRNLETLAQESRMARDQADSDGVRHFAELVVKEHDQMIKDLHEFCDKHDWAFDADPTRPDIKIKHELEGLRGKEFDRVYMSEANNELDQTVGYFETAMHHSDDHDLAKWSEKCLPELKERLANAKELYRKVKEKE